MRLIAMIAVIGLAGCGGQSLEEQNRTFNIVQCQQINPIRQARGFERVHCKQVFGES